MMTIMEVLKGLGAVASGAGFLTKILIGVGGLAALGIAYGVWHHEVYESGDRAGYARALAEIAAENERAIDQALQARSAWQACRARSGRWDQTNGECR